MKADAVTGNDNNSSSKFSSSKYSSSGGNASGGKALPALRQAFPMSLPVMAGYLFLGFAYGLYAHASGLTPLYPIAMAVLVYGGSLEFVLVSMLCAPFNPAATFIVALMVQARHLFYGLAMLGKYRGTGWKKFFLIYGMSDETFSINCSVEVPGGTDRGWFYLWVTWLDQLYWTAGAATGALLGQAVKLPTDGIDYIMTAMFVCIFLDRIQKEKQPWSALIGLGGSIVCLVIFGPDNFLIPSMAVIFVALTLLRGPIGNKLEYDRKLDSLSESDLPLPDESMENRSISIGAGKSADERRGGED